jgi:membrane-associated protease RseP (regulator of RpoE activity)
LHSEVPFLERYSYRPPIPSWQDQLWISIGAGPEEVFVLAVPLLFVRRRGILEWRIGAFPLGVLLAVAGLGLARLSYHLYYGFDALQLLIWGLLSILLYLRLWVLWPFLIAHMLYDATLFPLGRFQSWQQALILAGAWGAAAAAALLFPGTGREKSESRKQPVGP